MRFLGLSTLVLMSYATGSSAQAAPDSATETVSFRVIDGLRQGAGNYEGRVTVARDHLEVTITQAQLPFRSRRRSELRVQLVRAGKGGDLHITASSKAIDLGAIPMDSALAITEPIRALIKLPRHVDLTSHWLAFELTSEGAVQGSERRDTSVAREPMHFTVTTWRTSETGHDLFAAHP